MIKILTFATSIISSSQSIAKIPVICVSWSLRNSSNSKYHKLGTYSSSTPAPDLWLRSTFFSSLLIGIIFNLLVDVHQLWKCNFLFVAVFKNIWFYLPQLWQTPVYFEKLPPCFIVCNGSHIFKIIMSQALVVHSTTPCSVLMLAAKLPTPLETAQHGCQH